MNKMSKKQLYLELALIVNKKMLENLSIPYNVYLVTEKDLLNKLDIQE